MLNYILDDMNEISQYQKELKQEIIEKWQESKKLPRKKKKQVRKELILDYQIASINLWRL